MLEQLLLLGGRRMFNPFTAKNFTFLMLFHFKNTLGEKVKLIKSTGFENLFCTTICEKLEFKEHIQHPVNRRKTPSVTSDDSLKTGKGFE